MNPKQEIGNKTEVEDNSVSSEQKGRYLYCLIGDAEERKFAYPAIGERQDKNHPFSKNFGAGVHSISYQDIAAVISSSPIIKYPISRENTMAHQKVLEELMKDFTVLPVRFGTIAGTKNGICAEERIREEVLKLRYKELKDLLIKMDNKIELGIKAFWIDTKIIFQEIVDENSRIRRLRQRLTSKPFGHPFGEKASLGEMVKNALENKKAKEEKDILDVLKKACVEWRGNKVFGDNMITNGSFLVEKSRVEEFDSLVNKLDLEYDGRIKFKYVGPIPPINFVELVIVLEGEKA